MTDVYFDSGIIVKLYVQELNSGGAPLVSRHTAPYALTSWQALEVRNAIRLKAFRREISPEEMLQSLAGLDEDIVAGRWVRPSYSVAAVEEKAEELSARHAVGLGCRTLDLLHVAAALIMGAKEFLTFDHRQAAMARSAGLTVKS